MILKKTSTKTAGKVYVYRKWNVYHHTNRRWCYLNKDHLSIPKIRIVIEATQKIAQSNIVAAQNTKNCFSRFFHGNNEFSLEPGMGIEKPMYSGSAASGFAQTIDDVGDVVSEFWEYCIIDERLSKSVAKDYKNIARRFLNHSNGGISRDTLRSYLNSYLGKAPKTYNNQLDGLRAFICRFMRQPLLMQGFKKAHVDYYNREVQLPTKKQLQKAFSALKDDRERAIFLLYASSGLRRSELLKLTFEEVDFDLRCIRSRNNTRTKKAGITFYSEEAEIYLKRYLESRNDGRPRLIRIDSNTFAEMWKQASKAAGCYIRPQILRKWHSTALGEQGVPDRYVDIYQGRAPRSVLAKHYTGKALETLKRIYDGAEPRIKCNLGLEARTVWLASCLEQYANRLLLQLGIDLSIFEVSFEKV